MRYMSYFLAWEAVSAPKTTNSLCDANMALFTPHWLVVSWATVTLLGFNDPDGPWYREGEVQWRTRVRSERFLAMTSVFINDPGQKEHAVPHGHALTHRHTETHINFLGIHRVVILWNIAQRIMGVRSRSKPRMRSVCNVIQLHSK